MTFEIIPSNPVQALQWYEEKLSECSFCQDGYFQDLTPKKVDKNEIPNDVKCDHCNGTALCFKKDCEDCEVQI